MLTLSVVVCLLGANEPKPNRDVFYETVREEQLAPLPEGVRALVAHGFVSRVEPRLGVPTVFFALRLGADAPAWTRADLTPTEAARRFLLEYAALYRLPGAEVASLRAWRVHDLGVGALVVSFVRRVDGAPVFRDALHVVMTRQRELVALTGFLNPNGAKERPGEAFRLLPTTALEVAAADALGVVLEGARVVREPDAEGWLRLGESAGRLHVARARRTWYGRADGLEAAWQVELSDDEGHAFLEVVSARDGQVLSRKDQTQTAPAYRVWAEQAAPFTPADSPFGDVTPHPTGVRQPPWEAATVASSLVSLDYGPTPRMDPWLPAGATSLKGNNIDAFADVFEPDGYNPPGGVLPDGGLLKLRDGGVAQADLITTVFDSAYDFDAGPQALTQVYAATTQLFFTTNWVHDWLYAYGFDEAAGNGQVDNFGRGGLGGDAVLVSSMDYSRPNNASMTTFGDGEAGALQMGNYAGRGAYGVTLATLPDAGVPPAARTNFGPESYDVSAALAVMQVDGGADGCSELVDRASLEGRVALSVGLGCPVRDRVLRAQDAGAIGVIVALAGPTSPNYGQYVSPIVDGTEPPTMALSGIDGFEVLSALDAGVALTARLYVVNAPARPSAFDSTVSVHEYGHFLSGRLVADASGLSSAISVSLGEGWSDFLSLMHLVNERDAQAAANANWQGVWATAAWANAGTDPDGVPYEVHWFGDRRVPYSVDPLKNGLSFRHIRDGATLPAGALNFALNSEVHNAGEVWATMLWECFVALLEDRQLAFTPAHEMMMRTLVASLKATPSNPDFLEARDAVLAVVLAEDRAAFEAMYRAFARRGAGPRAEAPSKLAANNAPVIEDTSTGDFVKVTGATVDDSITWCDRDGVLDVGETGVLRLTAKNLGVGAMSAPFAVKVVPLTRGVSIVGDPNALFSPVEPFGTTQASVQVQLTEGTMVQQLEFRVDVPGSTTSLPTLVNVVTNFDKVAGRIDDFETGLTLDRGAGWRRGNDLDGTGAGDSLWQPRIISPVSTVLWGPNPESTGHSWVTTPALAVGTLPLTVRFKQRWQLEATLGANPTFWDGAYIEVSEDGQQTWTPVTAPELSPGYNGAISLINVASGNAVTNLEVGRASWVNASPGYPAFVDQVINFGTRFTNKTINLRFVISADQNGSRAGWDLDDFEVSGISATPFFQRVADRKRCINRAPVVTAPLVTRVAERSTVTLPATPIDPDGDTLRVEWVQQAGPAVALMGDGFVAPEVTGDVELTFGVTVSDAVFSASADTKVVVYNVNRPPDVVASAPAATVTAGQLITLSATATDPDGDPVELTWVQTRGALAKEKAPGVFEAPATKDGSRLYFEVHASDGQAVTTAEVDVGLAPAGCGCDSAGGGLTLLALGAWELLRARRRRR